MKKVLEDFLQYVCHTLKSYSAEYHRNHIYLEYNFHFLFGDNRDHRYELRVDYLFFDFLEEYTLMQALVIPQGYFY